MSFLSNPPNGYFVRERIAGSSTDPDHRLCGKHDVPGAVCPNCDKPLLRLLSLDPTDSRLALAELPQKVDLFWCWTCNLAQEPLFYKLTLGGNLEFLEFGRGGAVTDFPFENYPPFFEGQEVVLNPIPSSEQGQIEEFLSGKVGHWPTFNWSHQVGGMPRLWPAEREAEVFCPLCDSRMPLLAAIGDSAPGGMSICGNSVVQHVFYLCRDCAVVGAIQTCD